MLNQLDHRLLQAMPRLKNFDEFKLFCDYLRENKWYLAEQACKTQGPTSDEYSGAFKVLEELLSVLSLDEYQVPSLQARRFE